MFLFSFATEVNINKTFTVYCQNIEYYQKMKREDFVKFFRDNEKLNKLTVDNRVEIFQSLFVRGSNLNKALLFNILFI